MDKPKNDELERLNWAIGDHQIEKSFDFPDYPSATAFVVRLALLAEKKNHHPDLMWTYRELHITLRTHDRDRVTEKDIDFALALEALLLPSL